MSGPPPNQVYTLQPAAGQSVDHQSLGFLAATVVVDNPTGQWWQVGDPPATVPPYTVGQTIALPAGTQVANVQPVTPPGQVSAPLAGQTTTVTYYGPSLPPNPGTIAAPPSLSQIGTLTVGANGGASLTTPPLPAGTNVLVLLSDQQVSAYGIAISDHGTGLSLYNLSSRPQPQFTSMPLVPSSDQQYVLQVSNSEPYSMTLAVYAAAGNLPTQVQPLEGFFRTGVEVVASGYAYYSAQIVTGDAGTFRWTVQNPVGSPTMMIVDSAFTNIANTGAQTQAIVLIANTSGTTQTIIGEVSAGVGSLIVNGPILVPPGYEARGYTYNQSGATVTMVVSMAYHMVPL